MFKKFLKIIGVVLVLIIIGIAAVILVNENDRSVVTNYVRNENLKTIKADWKGVPVDQHDRFVNHEHPFLPRSLAVLKWIWESNPQEEEKKNDRWRPQVLDPTEFLSSDRDGILWLGHAAFFIRLNGKSILLDPVFGNPPFVRTYLDVPSPLDKIRQVDYVLFSHDHRDHCDANSIKQIAEKFPRARLYAGLRMDELLRDWITPTNEVQTAGWYQQFALPDENVKIYFVPVRHWCRRGLFDTNHRLWGGYVIEGAGKTIYFSGDSGYGSHYRETAEVFPKIDYFLIGIGAYKPRWFMEPNHNDPDDAFRAFTDAGASLLVPMHYGRFDLSDEPPSEPLRFLQEAAAKAGGADKMKVLQIYESLIF